MANENPGPNERANERNRDSASSEALQKPGSNEILHEAFIGIREGHSRVELKLTLGTDVLSRIRHSWRLIQSRLIDRLNGRIVPMTSALLLAAQVVDDTGHGAPPSLDL